MNMKKVLFILVLVLMGFCSCFKSGEQTNQRLRQENQELKREIRDNTETLNALKEKIVILRKMLEEGEQLRPNRNQKEESRSIAVVDKNEKTIKYFIVLKIHQTTITLDPFEHIKNSLNDLTITFETTRNNYETIKVGSKLGGRFKSGSFLVDGDFSNLSIKVVDKYYK